MGHLLHILPQLVTHSIYMALTVNIWAGLKMVSCETRKVMRSDLEKVQLIFIQNMNLTNHTRNTNLTRHTKNMSRINPTIKINFQASLYHFFLMRGKK